MQVFDATFVRGADPLPLHPSRTATPQRNYAHLAPVNDLALHSNQGELISCDQSGAIKIWDLGADCCSHDLVNPPSPKVRDAASLTRLLCPAATRRRCADAVSLDCFRRVSARRREQQGLQSASGSSSTAQLTLNACTGNCLRLEHPTGSRLYVATTKNQVSSTLSVPHQSPRLTRYQVSLFSNLLNRF